jgi:2-keto-3-deoxy-L-fuconate dehydrogenase
VITGAGAGIGRASACLFAREGARVVCADLDPATGEETVRLLREKPASGASGETPAGGEGHFVRADAADAEGVRRLVDETVARYGKLDVFYANAGVVPGGTVLECSDEEWDRTMAINTRSVYLACKHAIPAMRANGGGSIICTSSVAGLVGVKNRAAYSASKMAVIGLVKSVALDFIQDRIRINAVCPGTVDTPSLQARLRATGDYETALEQFIARQPMGRLGKAEEIAALALYLASDESAYMTGSYLTIDGGLSL